ncbi:MAG: alanine racemase [Alphaproteobacteria bacterium]|nr:alanine racemase [Alphaproteobacteria bacterium]
MSRPIRAVIDLAAFRRNLGVARRRAPKSRIWAVMKANGYGHGLLRAAKGLAAADGFAMLDLDEAARLRDARIDKPILLLEGAFSAADVELGERLRLTLAVHDEAGLRRLEEARLARPLAVLLKINSGMNRLGFPPDQVGAAWARLKKCSSVASIGLMTHFADADGPSGVAWQMERFERATNGLTGETCLANSAAVLRHPGAQGDWARPGIMLYGGSPFDDESAENHGLAPVMTLESEVIGIQDLAAGESIGYGRSFIADRPMRVGVIACGYADGYPRHAPSGTPVLVAGERTVTAGRVSMDMITVDLTALPEAHVGAKVVLWGRGLAADEVAAKAGTVSYELFTKVTARVPFVEIEA